MKKPTKAQREVLEKMRDGQTLYWMGGMIPRAFLSGGLATVRTDTVLAMERTGWIERASAFDNTGKYALTDIGRAAITGETE